jgi:hypothetical protein
LIGFLHICAGMTSLLLGFGILKINWKSEEAKVKGEIMLKIGGILIIVLGIIRISVWFIMGL